MPPSSLSTESAPTKSCYKLGATASASGAQFPVASVGDYGSRSGDAGGGVFSGAARGAARSDGCTDEEFRTAYNDFYEAA
jgi:hypothetical protein